MDNFLNKILGRDEDKHHGLHASHATHTTSHQGDVRTDTATYGTTSSSAASYGGSSQSGRQGSSSGESHTTSRDGVNVHSTVSSDGVSTVSLSNQNKLNELVSRLGATHGLVDEYARQQNERINDAVQHEIDEVVARASREQDDLLRRANEHTVQLDAEYRAKLQKLVEEVDASKAKRIAELEKELNLQQANILKKARRDIDELNKKAANLKISALQDAQQRAAAEARDLTAQAANFGAASTIHQASGTTTIKTEVSAATSTKDVPPPQVREAAVTKVVEAHTVEANRPVERAEYHKTEIRDSDRPGDKAVVNETHQSYDSRK